MGHLIRKNSLAVNEILNRVNSEKTYFVYTDKAVRVLKIAAFLAFAFLIGKQFYPSASAVIQVRPVELVAGKTIFGEPLKNVDLIELSAVKPFMKKRTESELKIKGLVSAVAANGQLEMVLEDGSLLKVKHQMKIEQARSLAAKKVVMSGTIYKTADKGALIYEANSLAVL
ncbi:hypothetical protein H9X96_00300 [Pedobacter sp. N36a]|uniref:hypothetical protein n=1 Tax=Pedobacter sp. N36a TaxID=2767996 RepID=UPI00165727A8|nr:hypothetical protein [Pedobacter sp. N36a]MBC8984209.1 hypothetical protein [Pedobacter sp. N36a]